MNGHIKQFHSFSRQVTMGLKELKNIRLSTLRKVFSLMGKKEKIILSILTLALLLSALASLKNLYIQNTVPAADTGGTFTEVLKGQPQFLNPVLASSEPDLSLNRLLFASLYKYGPDGKIVPDLAESMPAVSEDQRQYTVKIRPGQKWHDGRTINADDVVFTVKTLQNPNLKTPYHAQWQTTTVEKLSENEVRFTTKDVSAPFFSNLTLPILPEFVWMKVDGSNFANSEFNLKAVGSGPYKISEIIKTPSGKVQSLNLDTFEEYGGKKPHIPKLTFKFADSDEEALSLVYGNEADAYGYQASPSTNADKTVKKFEKMIFPLPQYQTLFYNLQNKTLGEKSVRKALSLATDRTNLSQEAFAGQTLPPWETLAFSFGVEKPDGVTFNLEVANQTLDQAGWSVDNASGIRTKKNQPLSLKITTSDSPANNKVAQLLAEQWKRLKIKVDLEIVPARQLTEEIIKNRSFDILIFAQKFTGDPDPFVFWHSSQTKAPGLNLTGFANEQADKLITEARTNLNTDFRLKKYEELSNLLHENLPAFSLTQNSYVYLINKEVKNFSLEHMTEPGSRFVSITDWYIKEKRIWK